MLTVGFVHVRMLVASSFFKLVRARSSMAEQWPFKPRVAGSIPAALIIYDEGWRRFLTGLFDAVMYIMLKFTPCAEPVIGGKDLKRVSGLLWFNVS